jgi:hypothetical protein
VTPAPTEPARAAKSTATNFAIVGACFSTTSGLASTAALATDAAITTAA